MQLPIDYRSRPIKTKYIDEETRMLSHWFIFGNHADGSVDIMDGTCSDVFVQVPADAAERLIAARNEFVAKVTAEFCELNDDKAGG